MTNHHVINKYLEYFSISQVILNECLIFTFLMTFMPITNLKKKSGESPKILNTHDVSVRLPMNTKYISGNPLSRFLINHFVRSLVSIVFSSCKEVNTVLDVGCGEGIVPRQMRLIVPSAIFHGLDVEEELLVAARQIVPDMEFVKGSVYSLPFADAEYDLILCTEVLEHLENPESALSEIFRVSRGFVLLSVPNEPLWCMANMARGAYWRDLGNSPGHINHWRASDFARFISNFCSEVIIIKRPFPWTIVLCRK